MISSASSKKGAEDDATGESATVLWGPTEGIWATLVPLVSSLGFLAASWLFATLMPAAIVHVRHFVAGFAVEKKATLTSTENAEQEPQLLSDRAILAILFLVSAGLTAAAEYARTVIYSSVFEWRNPAASVHLSIVSRRRQCCWGASWLE